MKRIMIAWAVVCGTGAAVWAGQVQTENPSGPCVAITDMEVSLAVDFKSNSIPMVVKAVVENLLQDPLERAEFWICSTGNDRDFGAKLHHVYLLDDSGRKDLPFSIRTAHDRYQKGDEWGLYRVELAKPLGPGQTCRIQFEYTMSGKPDFSNPPIPQSNEGVKETCVRGPDYVWCPTPYHDSKAGLTLKLRRPTWTLVVEYPAGNIALTDGVLLSREEKDGNVRDTWKSSLPGMPYLYIGPYKMVSRTEDGRRFEMYGPNEQRLQRAATRLDEYARMYGLFCELYGDPGITTYRIVCCDVSGVGVGYLQGQTLDISMMEDRHRIAHEMAHAWWGGLVSTYGPGWKFLTEAMAEFSARWIERTRGEVVDWERSLNDDCILGFKQLHFCTFLPVSEPARRFPAPLTEQAGYEHWLFNTACRSRGPLVVNHIRLLLGDEVFFRCMRAFLDKYRGERAGIDEFVETIIDTSGRDMTAELKGLLWSTGFASYRVSGLVSEKAGEGYRTKVRIRNEGVYGLTCPLLLKTAGGDKREIFTVEGGQERELVFTTAYRVLEAIVDPDMTTLQYHPEQKTRLWEAMTRMPEGLGINEKYGKAYLLYIKGNAENAADAISDCLAAALWRAKVNNIDELLAKDGYFVGYVFMRGVFRLASDNRDQAEKDFKSTFGYMLRAMVHEKSIRVPEGYYQLGAIHQKDLGEYLSLLGLIAGREFAFENGSDDAAKILKVDEWKRWWENEGRTRKLDLGPLRERCEKQRTLFWSNQRTRIE